ncbi:hypothetical protein T265_02982 [Opisthorchis viverrini]|uniref:DNA/RNA-binding protein Alba-like domain-containing protein n=1 Tax=Opisthorchis viverrini TaxID=6198 RepID=A0A074ZU56_OPIVI|nr:hypothetical protein T265_02982 [Opisthorchis viverrini]KER30631.1 hypothetical protein T265_02982 [Opisthorchis viverrini]
MKTKDAKPGRVWEISELLAEEDHLSQQVKEYFSPTGFHHIFISAKSSMIAQTLYIGRRLDRLLHRYHSMSQTGLAKNPGELWLHGIGPRAIERCVDLALHLENRLYPGHISTSVRTSTCATIRQAIAAVEPGSVSITEQEQPKSAIHIQLRLIPTRG